MIKREWRQLLEMIKFSLGKGKAPELRVETDWGKFYRICKFHKIQSMVCPRNTEASKRTAASGRNIEKVSGSRVHGDCKRCGAGIFTGRIVGGF